PDNVLIMITNILKPNVKDWLEKVKEDFTFNIYVWEQNDLSRIIREKKGHFINQFPQLFSTGEPVEMYHIKMGEFYFGIDELEEVELRAFNCDDVEEAKEKIKEFIAFIKANDINIK
ncbi:MAG: hypothetical protein K0R46_3135, partial [Herbinix sp.]|nr:hypothetical protein [Herbinix sp.]